MRKIFLAAFFALLLNIFAKGQTTNNDTLFKITYYPSFHNGSQFIVYKDHNISKAIFKTVSLYNGTPKFDTAYSTISDETFQSYLTFFLSYSFPGYIDNKRGDSTKLQGGVDGINIDGIFYTNSIKKPFKFWSPYHDQQSMTLFKMSLSDLNKYFKTKDNKKYLRSLKMYTK